MKTFFDSSAFSKRYVNESNSGLIEEICAKSVEIAVSIICVPEVISALSRLKREKFITLSEYRLAKDAFLADIGDAIVCDLSDDTIQYSISILENNLVRAMDALHVASAIEWGADVFVSADKRQLAAAKNSGIDIISVNEHK